LKRKVILENKPNNHLFHLEWKEKYPNYIDIYKVLLMIPLILKNVDYFDVLDRKNIAYYELDSFIAFSGKKYVFFQRVFDSYSTYWVYYSSNEEPKRIITLKALYGKCLFFYYYPVILLYKSSNKTSKIINDENLIIDDIVKTSMQNFCEEKDKELVEIKKQKKKKEHFNMWKNLIEKDILTKYGNFHFIYELTFITILYQLKILIRKKKILLQKFLIKKQIFKSLKHLQWIMVCKNLERK